MEQFELNTQPIVKKSYDMLQESLRFLEIAKVDKVNARSTQEAFGDNYSRLMALKGLEKLARKAMDEMADYINDNKTVIEQLDQLKIITEKIITLAMDWNIEASLCLKKLAFLDLSEIREAAAQEEAFDE